MYQILKFRRYADSVISMNLVQVKNLSEFPLMSDLCWQKKEEEDRNSANRKHKYTLHLPLYSSYLCAPSVINLGDMHCIPVCDNSAEHSLLGINWAFIITKRHQSQRFQNWLDENSNHVSQQSQASVEEVNESIFLISYRLMAYQVPI